MVNLTKASTREVSWTDVARWAREQDCHRVRVELNTSRNGSPLVRLPVARVWVPIFGR